MKNVITTVLFDLDGTLLPMDQDEFTKGYFKYLIKKLAPHGYEPDSLINAIWHGTGAMVKNRGEKTNEQAFWEDFAVIYGADRAERDRPLFEEFYDVDFKAARQTCGYTPMAREAVDLLKNKGKRLILATNPIFPLTATKTRTEWAGLDLSDFEICTTYENINFCKPNPEYYLEILRRSKLTAEECLMVGNDVSEDMIAETLGIDVFLLTDCMINKSGESIDKYKHGNFSQLLEYLKAI
ncbi:MAG: HAD family hydrolase [Clostridia bacterium]|nr:HAD family hydrolase [Clostridia bacterium]